MGSLPLAPPGKPFLSILLSKGTVRSRVCINQESGVSSSGHFLISSEFSVQTSLSSPLRLLSQILSQDWLYSRCHMPTHLGPKRQGVAFCMGNKQHGLWTGMSTLSVQERSREAMDSASPGPTLLMWPCSRAELWSIQEFKFEHDFPHHYKRKFVKVEEAGLIYNF